MQVPTILEKLIAEHLERCENDVDRTVESILTFLTTSKRPMYVKDGILSQSLRDMTERLAAHLPDPAAGAAGSQPQTGRKGI